MNKNTSIKLGRGLGDIAFGMTKADLENLIGAPEATETLENEVEELGESHIWHYDSANLSFSFEEVDEYKLSAISASSDKYLLRDVIRTGMRKEKVLDTLEEINMLNYAEEDHSNADSPNSTLVTIDEKSLYLWFENDILVEIQWFPLYNEDEEIIWPK